LRGVAVRDIIGQQEPKLHTLTSFAHVDGLRITYPPAQSGLFDLEN